MSTKAALHITIILTSKRTSIRTFNFSFYPINLEKHQKLPKGLEKKSKHDQNVPLFFVFQLTMPNMHLMPMQKLDLKNAT